MAQRRIYVVWTHPLFRESVRMLLDHPEIIWVGMTSNFIASEDEINNLQPDTILVEEVDGNVPSDVLEILETCPWNVRVIGLSLSDNKLNIFHREQGVVERTDDFLHLILGDDT